MTTSHLHALVDYGDPYVQPLLLAALKTHLPASSYTIVKTLATVPVDDVPILQFREYESLDFELGFGRSKSLLNAYIIRKALIRKHYLSNTVSSWVTKNPESSLKRHFKPCVSFELDYAEFLDEALVEAYELHETFAANEGKSPRDREWWILKPGMSDRGQGIRLFSTEAELTAIFEEWEENQISEEDEESEPSSDTNTGGIITSQLRHFVAQPYIGSPLLISSSPASNRKFHIRTYVVAVGALSVYVYQPMLALFASLCYVPPESCFNDLNDMQNRALTNTCLQSAISPTTKRSSRFAENVFLFDLLDLPSEQKMNVISQINLVTAELFQAAVTQATHFQPLPSSFEIFGVDFLVDTSLNAWLLEVNAFPDFAQTGEELKNVIVKGLFEEVVSCVIAPFFGIGKKKPGDGSERLVKVLDTDMGRR